MEREVYLATCTKPCTLFNLRHAQQSTVRRQVPCLLERCKDTKCADPGPYIAERWLWWPPASPPNRQPQTIFVGKFSIFGSNRGNIAPNDIAGAFSASEGGERGLQRTDSLTRPIESLRDQLEIIMRLNCITSMLPLSVLLWRPKKRLYVVMPGRLETSLPVTNSLV